jgi:hypothetical protein
MSNECKNARNVVVTTIVVLMTVIMILCSSCSSTYSTCPAYASVEVENNNN